MKRLTKIIFLAAITVFTGMIAGCSHNINVQGWGIACPYGAMGYGTFSCVKENVKVTATEKVNKNGTIESINQFEVGEQTTGNDVDLLKAKINNK